MKNRIFAVDDNFDNFTWFMVNSIDITDFCKTWWDAHLDLHEFLPQKC